MEATYKRFTTDSINRNYPNARTLFDKARSDFDALRTACAASPVDDSAIDACAANLATSLKAYNGALSDTVIAESLASDTPSKSYFLTGEVPYVKVTKKTDKDTRRISYGWNDETMVVNLWKFAAAGSRTGKQVFHANYFTALDLAYRTLCGYTARQALAKQAEALDAFKATYASNYAIGQGQADKLYSRNKVEKALQAFVDSIVDDCHLRPCDINVIVLAFCQDVRNARGLKPMSKSAFAQLVSKQITNVLREVAPVWAAKPIEAKADRQGRNARKRAARKAQREAEKAQKEVTETPVTVCDLPHKVPVSPSSAALPTVEQLIA